MGLGLRDLLKKKEDTISLSEHQAAIDEINKNNEERENALHEELIGTSAEYKKAKIMADMAENSVIIWSSLLGVALASAGIKIYKAYKGE